MTPRVILDIGFLGHAQDDKSARRGAQRVASHLFSGLASSGQAELFFVATTHLAGAYDFLAAQGISPAVKLREKKGQLALSRMGRRFSRIIHRSVENRRLYARAGRRLLAEITKTCLAGESKLTPAMLAAADIYHSPHTPFPEAVHNHASLKKFLTLHDFIPLKNPEYFSNNAKPFMAAVLRCLTPDNFAFCVSEATRNDTLNLARIPPEHVFVTPLAADPVIFQPVSDAQKITAACRRCGIPDGPYFLALSAHDRHKNFPHLIRCFGALVEAGETDANLVIVGHNLGRNPEVMEALVKYPRVKARVVIAGFVPDEDLAPIYSGATAFLFPSFAEGFGIPPLEAMQCGTPVIASNTTSIPEVVGDAGILLPPGAEAAWCQAMLNISRQENLRAELKRKSLVRSKLFSWEKFTRQTLQGYQKSLAAG